MNKIIDILISEHVFLNKTDKKFLEKNGKIGLTIKPYSTNPKLIKNILSEMAKKGYSSSVNVDKTEYIVSFKVNNTVIGIAKHKDLSYATCLAALDVFGIDVKKVNV